MIGALIKPQLGILVPVVAVVTIARALRPAADPGETVDPAGTPEAATGGLLDRLRAWERRTAHPYRIVTTGLAGLLTAFVLCAPFGLSVIEFGDGGLRSGLIEQIFKTAGGYP